MSKRRMLGFLNKILLTLGLIPTSWALTDIEKQFIDVPSPEEARASLKHITSKPHVAGSQGDLEVRKRTYSESREGFEVTLPLD